MPTTLLVDVSASMAQTFGNGPLSKLQASVEALVYFVEQLQVLLS